MPHNFGEDNWGASSDVDQDSREVTRPDYSFDILIPQVQALLQFIINFTEFPLQVDVDSLAHSYTPRLAFHENQLCRSVDDAIHWRSRIAIGEDLPVAMNRKFRPGQTVRVELDLDVQPDLLIEINEASQPPATSPVAATTPEHSDEPAQLPRRRVPASASLYLE